MVLSANAARSAELTADDRLMAIEQLAAVLAISHSGVMRALCDARVEVALHGPDGATVGVAPASQQIPWWLRRQVQARDITCRGFGCERTIRQIHHIHHWANGGETNLDNLVGLCWEHHHLVHEGGWAITNPNHEISFIAPEGRRRIPSRPQPLRTTTSDRLRRIAGLEPHEPDTTRQAADLSEGGPTPRRGPPAAPT